MTPEQQTAVVLAGVWRHEMRNAHCVGVTEIESKGAAQRMIEALSKAGLVTLPKDWISALARNATSQERNIA